MKGTRSIAEWRSLLEDPSSSVWERLREIYGDDESEIRRRLPTWTGALAGFAPGDAIRLAYRREQPHLIRETKDGA